MANTLNTVNLPNFNNLNSNALSGQLGQISVTTNGIAGVGGGNVSYNYAGYTTNSTVMTVKGDPASLEVKGKLVHNGRDLEERLDTIEKVLAIPERDVKLEARYPKLKKMYDEYIKELSKVRMWENLKGEE